LAKNGFLERQEAAYRMIFQQGLYGGRQQILDMMSIVLNDPDIMGRDTFGKERLMKVVKGIGECLDYYQKAWERDDETDYYRVKMDKELARIYGPELHDSFLERYQMCPDYDYKKGKWKR
jgi:hypothetical protein